MHSISYYMVLTFRIFARYYMYVHTDGRKTAFLNYNNNRRATKKSSTKRGRGGAGGGGTNKEYYI